jgi:hypothetical protein
MISVAATATPCLAATSSRGLAPSSLQAMRPEPPAQLQAQQPELLEPARAAGNRWLTEKRSTERRPGACTSCRYGAAALCHLPFALTLQHSRSTLQSLSRARPRGWLRSAELTDSLAPQVRMPDEIKKEICYWTFPISSHKPPLF